MGLAHTGVVRHRIGWGQTEKITERSAVGVSVPWDPAMDFLGNAKAAVAVIRDRLKPSLSIVGGADLAPGKRVYLFDLIEKRA